MSFPRPALLGLLVLATALLLWAPPVAAAPIPVRFSEGATHGFLVLGTVDGDFIASGDLLQSGRGGAVKSHMVFHFKDGSVFDETVVFTQRSVFTMQSYHLVQRGPAFPEDTEISLDRASGKYRVKTKARQDGREQVLAGKLDLPPDVYNGMVLTVAKNLRKGVSETVHIVAFTPKPLLIKLKLAPVGEHKVMVGELEKTATHYVFEPTTRDVAYPFRQAAGAHAPGLPRLGRNGRAAGVREVRRAALHDGAGLEDRADEPPLARLAIIGNGSMDNIAAEKRRVCQICGSDRPSDLHRGILAGPGVAELIQIDHLLSHEWERLVEIQEIQMELINETRRQR